MAISDTITSMYENVGNVYDVLELAGADLTNVDKNIENLKQSWEERLLYFLANGTDVVWNNWLPKVTGTGESITLNNTIEAKMDFVYKGNTYQETTTGKNLLQRATGKTKNGITFTILDDNSVKVSGTATANVSLNFSTNATGDAINIPAGTYVLSGCPSGGSSSTYKLATNIADITSNDYGSGVTITANTEQISKALWITIYSGTTCNNLIFKPMLRLSNTTDDYEPYTNGASPNPDYPQDIQVVSGDNTIKVEGKNLWDFANNNFTGQNAFDSVRNSDGSITFTCSNNGYCFAKHTITLDAGTYTLSTSSNSNFTVLIGGTEYSKTFTINETKNVDIRCFKANATTGDTLTITWIQLEKGNQATTYEAYKGASYPISLGNIELCKIGTYQDSIVKDNGKWYLNKQIGKVVLDGSETGWNVYGTGTDNWFYYVGTSHIPKIQLNNQDTGYCSHYIPINVGTATTDYGMSLLTNGIVRIRYGQEDVVSNYTNWLSTHNVSIYYILTTPTYEEITDTTLLSQLEALAYSYEGTTNISQVNDDLAFVLDITALKEMS